jgi:hypothetical protein
MSHMNEICWAFQDNPVPSERRTDASSRTSSCESVFSLLFRANCDQDLIKKFGFQHFLMQIQHEY